MVTWTKEQFLSHQKKHQAAKNAYDDHAQDTREDATVEPSPLQAVAQSQKDEAASAARVHIRIISVRRRLADPDALVPKWHIDSLRYCGAIREDSAKDITLEIGQRKAASGEEEHTEITLTYP